MTSYDKFKYTSDHVNHGSKQYEPCSDCSLSLMLVHIVCNICHQSTSADEKSRQHLAGKMLGYFMVVSSLGVLVLLIEKIKCTPISNFMLIRIFYAIYCSTLTKLSVK